MFLSRKSDSKLDFDLELVKQKSMDNPVYYVQYAHCAHLLAEQKGAEAGKRPAAASPASLALLDTQWDMEILRLLDQFPDFVEAAARTQSPHVISMYLQELASTLHRYYTNCHVLNAADDLATARLMLLDCVANVVRNGLALPGRKRTRIHVGQCQTAQHRNTRSKSRSSTPHKRTYDFSLSLPGMISAVGAGVLALTFFFVMGILIGRGYRPKRISLSLSRSCRATSTDSAQSRNRPAY